MPRAKYESTLSISGTPVQSFRFKITERKHSCWITIDFNRKTGAFGEPRRIPPK